MEEENELELEDLQYVTERNLIEMGITAIGCASAQERESERKARARGRGWPGNILRTTVQQEAKQGFWGAGVLKRVIEWRDLATALPPPHTHFAPCRRHRHRAESCLLSLSALA